jgi:hypothetical protein
MSAPRTLACNPFSIITNEPGPDKRLQGKHSLLSVNMKKKGKVEADISQARISPEHRGLLSVNTFVKGKV